MKELQNEIRYTQQPIDSQKSKLINDFEEWYAETFEDENDRMAAEMSQIASSHGGRD